MHFQVLYECMESLWSFNTALQVHRVVICEFVLICYLHYVTSWIYCTCNFRINLTTSLITINCCHDWNPQAKMGCKSVIMFYWHHMMMFFFFSPHRLFCLFTFYRLHGAAEWTLVWFLIKWALRGEVRAGESVRCMMTKEEEGGVRNKGGSERSLQSDGCGHAQ